MNCQIEIIFEWRNNLQDYHYEWYSRQVQRATYINEKDKMRLNTELRASKFVHFFCVIAILMITTKIEITSINSNKYEIISINDYKYSIAITNIIIEFKNSQHF